jgi:anti-sigma B factor antagonist
MTMSVQFSVELAHLDGNALVVVTGDVDMATAPEMERVLLDALNRASSAHLMVDMAACSFIDCIGMRVLVDAAQMARSLGGSVTLREPSPQVCRVRKLVGLEQVLPTEEEESHGARRPQPAG